MKIISLSQFLLRRFLVPLILCTGAFTALAWGTLEYSVHALEELWGKTTLHWLTQRVFLVGNVSRALEISAQTLAAEMFQRLRTDGSANAPELQKNDLLEMERYLHRLLVSSLPSPRGLRTFSLALFDPTGKLQVFTGERRPARRMTISPRPGAMVSAHLTPGDLARGPTLQSFFGRPDGSVLALDLEFSREILEDAFRQISAVRTLPFVNNAGLYAVENGRPLSPFFVPIPPREVLAARTYFRQGGPGGSPLRQAKGDAVTLFLLCSPQIFSAFGSPPQMLRLALDFSALKRWRRHLFSAAGTAWVLGICFLAWSQRHAVGVALRPLKELTGHMGRLAREKETYRGAPPLQTRVREFVELYIHLLRMGATVSESLARQREADAVRSSLLANVSHEFRTPMTAIKGFSQMMRDRLDQTILSAPEASLAPELRQELQEQRSDLEILLEETARLENLVERVLDLASLQGEEEHWHMELLDPRLPVEKALEVYLPLMEGTPVTLHLEVEPDLPRIRGDARRLTQVVEHLLSNALKFTSQGSVFCSVRHEGGFVVTRVEDTGPGVDPSQRHAIFEAFAQSGDVLTAKPAGAGLGLPLCKSIVQRHGGWIHMTSRKGVGSVFFFGLPAQLREEGDRTPSSPEPPPNS